MVTSPEPKFVWSPSRAVMNVNELLHRDGDSLYGSVRDVRKKCYDQFSRFGYGFWTKQYFSFFDRTVPFTADCDELVSETTETGCDVIKALKPMELSFDVITYQNVFSALKHYFLNTDTELAKLHCLARCTLCRKMLPSYSFAMTNGNQLSLNCMFVENKVSMERPFYLLCIML